jgi:hypothetical protein
MTYPKPVLACIFLLQIRYSFAIVGLDLTGSGAGEETQKGLQPLCDFDRILPSKISTTIGRISVPGRLPKSPRLLNMYFKIKQLAISS